MSFNRARLNKLFARIGFIEGRLYGMESDDDLTVFDCFTELKSDLHELLDEDFPQKSGGQTIDDIWERIKASEREETPPKPSDPVEIVPLGNTKPVSVLAEAAALISPSLIRSTEILAKQFDDVPAEEPKPIAPAIAKSTKITDDQLDLIVERRKAGESYAKIGFTYKCSDQSVRNFLAFHGIDARALKPDESAEKPKEVPEWIGKREETAQWYPGDWQEIQQMVKTGIHLRTIAGDYGVTVNELNQFIAENEASA